MRFLKLLFFVVCSSLLCISVANANIDIDETFEDSTPFTDLGWVYGVDNPSTATIKGISIFRNGSAAYPPTATIAYNAITGNVQGSRKDLGGGKGIAWKLAPGQKMLWGKSGSSLYPSGDGIIADDGLDIKIAQVGLAFDQMPTNSSSTLIGSVSYLFGNTAQSTTTFSLAYELRPRDSGSALLREIRSNGTSRTLGVVLPRKFSMLTTVWAGGLNNKWGTIPKTNYGMEMYPPHFPDDPWKYGWEIDINKGTADGCLYPKGKGWPNGAALTSSSEGIAQYGAVYSFLDTKPASYGTTASMPYLADSPWRIPHVFSGNTKSSQTLALRTWRIAAGDTNAVFYIDDLYLESCVRNDSMTSADKKAADYRLHEFDQNQRFKRNSNQMFYLSANPQYADYFDPPFITGSGNWELY